jgi:hypothetical protein
MAEPTVRTRQLGGELRRTRETAGRKGPDVAASLGWPTSKLSRIENGSLGVKPADLDALMDEIRIHDADKRELLHAIARHGRQRGWWQTYRDTISPAYADLISLEDGATSIRT